MPGGFSPSKVSELISMEPSAAIKIKKVELGKGKGNTRIPFVNFSVFNIAANKFDLPIMRDNNIRMAFGVEDMAQIEKERLEMTWNEKKRERKIRVGMSEFPNLVGFLRKSIKHIQSAYKTEIPDKADDIEQYFHRKETADMPSKNRDWPLKFRSESSIDENGKKGPGKEYFDSNGNPDPKIQLVIKFAGNQDDKWPAKFPIESMQNRPQETEFLDYDTIRLDGPRVVYDPIKIDGESVNPGNLHKALPRGVIIHEIDYFFKSGGFSGMDGGSPFMHIWVTRCVIQLPETKDLDTTASADDIIRIQEIMRIRALKNAGSGVPPGAGIQNANSSAGGADSKQEIVKSVDPDAGVADAKKAFLDNM